MEKGLSVLFAAALTAWVLVPAQAADTSSARWLPKPAANGKAWTAKELARLRHDIDSLLARRTVRGAHIGLIAIDTRTGSTLYSRDADEEFMPASTFKLLVGSAALYALGPNFSFDTTVLADAPIQGGTLDGNLYLHGSGDALLTAKALDAAAKALAAAGLRNVTGALITDASYFDSERLGEGWSTDDLPYYYAPVVSALCLEDNVIHIYMTPGAQPGAPVRLRVEPLTSALTIDNQLVTGQIRSKDTSDLSRPWDQPRTLRLTGQYPLGAKESGDLRAAVPDPESYAGDVFARALARAGIAVAGGVRSGATPKNAMLLYDHASERLRTLLADFWYPSDNLVGELLLKRIGIVRAGAPGTTENGAAYETQFLKLIGIDPSTVTIADGSGLSQYDRITPRDELKVLQSDWDGPYRDLVLDALPVAGVRGSLKSSYVGTPAERNVFAKTGSISHVRTIAGFLRTKRHGAVTFAFMLDDWMEDLPDLAGLRAAVFTRFITD